MPTRCFFATTTGMPLNGGQPVPEKYAFCCCVKLLANRLRVCVTNCKLWAAPKHRNTVSLAHLNRVRVCCMRPRLQQLADVLAYLHSQGICHGDVRCQNIFFTSPDVHQTDVSYLCSISHQPRSTLAVLTWTAWSPYAMFIELNSLTARSSLHPMAAEQWGLLCPAQWCDQRACTGFDGFVAHGCLWVLLDSWGSTTPSCVQVRLGDLKPHRHMCESQCACTLQGKHVTLCGPNMLHVHFSMHVFCTGALLMKWCNVGGTLPLNGMRGLKLALPLCWAGLPGFSFFLSLQAWKGVQRHLAYLLR